MVGMLIRSADVCASYRPPLQSAHLSHTPNVKLIEHTCLLLRVATLRARGVVEMDVLHLQVAKKYSETPMDICDLVQWHACHQTFTSIVSVSVMHSKSRADFQIPAFRTLNLIFQATYKFNEPDGPITLGLFVRPVADGGC
jgi:hypothetical protein